MSKTRRFNPQFLKLGFKNACKNSIERPLCVICGNLLSAESMKPKRLREHLESWHKDFLYYSSSQNYGRHAKFLKTRFFFFDNPIPSIMYVYTPYNAMKRCTEVSQHFASFHIFFSKDNEIWKNITMARIGFRPKNRSFV